MKRLTSTLFVLANWASHCASSYPENSDIRKFWRDIHEELNSLRMKFERMEEPEHPDTN